MRERGDAIWVNLYVASTADIKLDNGRTRADDAGDALPVGGRGQNDRDARPERAVSRIHVRIPGWARNEPVASDLYRFEPSNASAAVRSRSTAGACRSRSTRAMSTLTRTWKKGDTIELALPMPVRRVVANDHVVADRGRVALERGPIVYAAEWVDNPNGKVRNLLLARPEQN